MTLISVFVTRGVTPPKTTVEPACLWLSRLLPGVGACFDFVVDSERLSRMGTVHKKRTPGVHDILFGFSAVRCTSIRITVTLGYEQPLVCGSHHIDNLMAWFIFNMDL
jgi:hypothetical protein